MTLKSCPECSHNVSSAASACPSCGFPLKEDPFIEYTQRRLEFRKKVAVGLIVVTLLFALLGFVSSKFLSIAFGTGYVALVLLISLPISQARLNKSKLKD